jgi:hypothetical protein
MKKVKQEVAPVSTSLFPLEMGKIKQKGKDGEVKSIGRFSNSVIHCKGEGSATFFPS